jgi:hypothetical protein
MMATWNASANAQMAQIATELTAQQNQDVRAAISRWADQHHDGNAELRAGDICFKSSFERRHRARYLREVNRRTSRAYWAKMRT